MRGRPAPGRRPPKALAALAAAATGFAVVVVVTARVLMGQAGFTESGLENKIRDEQRRVEQLEVSVAQLRSPSRISKRARELGLVVPEEVTYLAPGSIPTPSAAPAPRPALQRQAKPASPGRRGR